ncbi:hypothetical protein [Alcaligenes ammonioxydans]|uniref:hypothetical protein n=1 Tax=Alcaligenes ammonioxydans TaxID=2582914 RepID=UPI003D22D389
MSSDEGSRRIPPSKLSSDDYLRSLLGEDQSSNVNDAKARRDVNDENKRLDKKDRKHEFTVAITLLLVSLVDAVLFMFIENWSAPLVVGAIQLLAALIFAKNYGVEEIQVWLNKVIDKFPHNGHGKHLSKTGDDK